MTSDYATMDTIKDNYLHVDLSFQYPRGEDNKMGNTLTFLGYLRDLMGKLLAGYPVTITDLWSRVLAFRITNSPDLVVGKTYSGYATESKNIKEHMMPLPILITSDQKFDTYGNFTTDNNIVIIHIFFLVVLANVN